MSFLVPRSLRSQTLAVLFIGFTLSHIIGVTIYSFDRQDAVTSTEALDVAERIVGIVNLLRQVPPQWRDDVIRASGSRAFRVTSGSERPAAKLRPASDLTEEITAFLEGEFSGWPRERFIVGFVQLPSADPAGMRRDEDASRGERLHVSIELEDGSWLTFTGAIPRVEAHWPGTAGAYILTLALGIGIVAVWLVQRVTSPLSAFAVAADRLGKDMRAAPLPESGPVEVVQAAHAFNEMQKRLRRLVENRTRMLAAISHDLRTPITLVRLRTELVADDEERTKTLRTLDEMEAMIASVLEFARETTGDEPQRKIDMSALLASICDDAADAGAAVEFTTTGQIVFSGRHLGLKRAFTNIVDNAIKYGRRADVKISESPVAIDVTVDDEGPGVVEGEIEKMFMPFYRVDGSRSRETGGVGLGLSIARAVIHEHGGTIVARNRAEGGLQVHVSLPK